MVFAVQAHLDGDSDGYCDDCGYLLTRFSVIVPAGMTLTVSKTGTVYAASNVRIVNRSTGAVSVSSVTLQSGRRMAFTVAIIKQEGRKREDRLLFHH